MTGLYLVADDLTGALDSAVAFCGRFGPVPVHLGAPHDMVGLHAAVDLATRDAHPSFAVARTSSIAERLGVADIAFKKIDSRLRGHWAVELAALMRGGPFAFCAMAPAFPAQGRITLNGRQVVRAASGLVETEPVDPLATMRAVGLRVQHVPVGEADVPYPRNDDADAPQVLLFDASTDDDLKAIVRNVMQRSGTAKPVLWCGAAGLSKALAPEPAPRAERMPRPLLAIVGTDHAVSREQVAIAIAAGASHQVVRDSDLEQTIDGVNEAFRSRGHCLLTFDLAQDTTAAQARHHIEQSLRELLPRIAPPTALVATGGETLLGICRAVAARRLDVDAEASPGIPHSMIRGGLWDGVHVLSKSGGFGAPEWLAELILTS